MRALVSGTIGVAVFGAMALGLAACDDGGGTQDGSHPRAPQPEMMMADAPPPVAGAVMARAAPEIDQPRIEIARRYGIEVTDGSVETAMEADREACLALGCTVTAVRTAADPRHPTAHLEALVPGEQADAFHARVSGVEGRVVTQYVETAANREQQYQDIQARLERLEFMRTRLYALAEQKSDQVGDLLQVERELMRVETEIERITRAKMGLEKVTDNVRVTLNYSERPPKAGDVDFGPFTGLLADMANALITGVRATLLFVARWLPALVIVALGVVLVRRWRAKRSGD